MKLHVEIKPLLCSGVAIAAFLVTNFASVTFGGVLSSEPASTQPNSSWTDRLWNPSPSVDFNQTLSAYTSRSSSNPERLKEAVDLFRQQKFDGCLDLLISIEKTHRWFPSAHIVIALMFVDAELPQQARISLESAVSKQPESPFVYEIFGRVALLERRPTDARLHFERSLKLAQSQKWSPTRRGKHRNLCWLGMAGVAEQRGEWESARKYLAEVLKTGSPDNATRQRHAFALFNLDRPDDAFQELVRIAATVKTPTTEPEIAMANIYIRQGKHTQAEEWLRKAQKSHPDNDRVRIRHAAWLLDRGRIDEAAEQIGRLPASDADTSTWALRGMLARSRREYKTAAETFQNLVKEQPGNFSFSNQLALCLIENADQSDKQRAIQLAEVNVRQYPNSKEALATLGWLYYRIDRKRQAVTVLNQVTNGGDVSSDSAYYLATILSDSGNSEAARKLLAAALTSNSAFFHREDAKKLLRRLPQDESDAKAQER